MKQMFIVDQTLKKSTGGRNETLHRMFGQTVYVGESKGGSSYAKEVATTTTGHVLITRLAERSNFILYNVRLDILGLV